MGVWALKLAPGAWRLALGIVLSCAIPEGALAGKRLPSWV